MKYEININNFQGPLDLLLHLIKQSKVSITEISILEIIEQYMNFIKYNKEMNLDIASEYLTMAAELIEIKSNILLPKKENITMDDDYEENAKNDLINRLLQYEQYKLISEKLKDFEIERKKIFTKEISLLDEYVINDEIIDDNFTTNDLFESMKKILERLEEEKPLNTKIAKNELSINEKMDEIRNIIKKNKKINFVDLFHIKSKPYIIITFLSILNMAKQNEIIINQDDNFKNIIIEST